MQSNKPQEEGAGQAAHGVDAVRSFYQQFPYPDVGPNGMYAYLRMRRKLFQSLGLPLTWLKGRSVLEAACGTGESTAAIALLTKARVVGIDFSQPSIDRAVRLGERLDLENLEFTTADFTGEGQLGGPFDMVICEAVHQTDDPAGAVATLACQVAAGGYLVLSVANKIGNAGDTARAGLVSMLAGSDPQRRIALARRLFFRGRAPGGRVRGVPKAELGHLQQVIADIYGFPDRRTYPAGVVLDWIDAAGLELTATIPSLGSGRPTRRRILCAELEMLRRGQYHFVVAARLPRYV